MENTTENILQSTEVTLNSTANNTLLSNSSFVNTTVSSAVAPPSCFVFTIVVDGILLGLISLIGMIGNTISFCTWRSVSISRGLTSSTLMLQALAVSDTLMIVSIVLVVLVPVNILLEDAMNIYIRIFRPYIFNYFFPFGVMANCFTIWTTLLITIHRYLALCHPFAGPTKTCTSVRATFIQLAIILTASVAYNTPRFFEYTLVYNPTYDAVIIGYSKLSLNPIYQISYRVITYHLFVASVPLFITTLLTIRIVITLIAAAKARKQMSGEHQSQRSTTILLLSVVVLFIVCQFPTAVFRIILALNVVDVSCGSSVYYLQDVALLMVVINSSSNVFIYAFCSKDFRKYFCCRKGDKPQQAGNSYVSNTIATTMTTTAQESPM